MYGGLQPMLIAGKSAAGEDFSSVLNPDEVLNGGTLRDEKPLLSSLEYPYDPSSSTTGLPLTSYGFFTGDFQGKELVEGCLTDYYGGDWSLRTEGVEAEGNHLKMPKLETSTTEPFNFIPPSSDLVWSFSNQLPELQSLEQVHQDEKRFKPSFGDAMNPYALQAMLMKNIQLTANYFSPAPLQQVQPAAPTPTKKKQLQMEKARRRRVTLGEKARSLQKVLPWDKKMDMATMYEETYKYIKFLQAQISVLESMPLITTTPPPPSSSTFSTSGGGELFPDLGKLNRQQLLEVVVNSPVVQTILYSKGCCIYSLEQLMMFKEITNQNIFLFNPSFFT